MKSKNVTINGVDSIYDILRDVSTYFGLKWYQVKPGILKEECSCNQFLHRR